MGNSFKTDIQCTNLYSYRKASLHSEDWKYEDRIFPIIFIKIGKKSKKLVETNLVNNLAKNDIKL